MGRRQLSAYWEHAREAWSRFPESGAIFGFLAVLIFFIIATALKDAPAITSGRSVASITTNAASQGIIAVGVTMLMISGEFDLSVGSTLGLSALMFIIAAEDGPAGIVEAITSIIPFIDGELLVHNWGIPGHIEPDGLAVLFSVLVSLITGALLGLINGLLLVVTRIPSFIVTLGTLYIYRSVMLNIIPGGTIARYTEAPLIWTLPSIVIILLILAAAAVLLILLVPSLRRNWFRLRENSPTEIGTTFRFGLASVGVLIIVGIALRLIVYYALDAPSPVDTPFFDIMNGKFAFVNENFRAAIFWWLFMAGIFTIILTQTSYGNAVFAAGGNPEAARAQGINVSRVKVTNFMISGVLAAVAGITEASRFEVVEPLRGTGYELDVIAATVIGGTLLTGGYGSIVGTILGILIAFMLKSGLVLIDGPTEWYRGVLGIIMIVAVIINTNIRRQR